MSRRQFSRMYSREYHGNFGSNYDEPMFDNRRIPLFESPESQTISFNRSNSVETGLFTTIIDSNFSFERQLE